MLGDLTQVQGDDELHRARDLSLQRQQPPTDVPGYEPERFLGAGAYGEVWVAVDRNTGRRVAIKFYAHRGGLDWSLLSREVDKLALLFSDRHVVQLVEVGWDADPPYYVMEYLAGGSLEDLLGGGPMPVPEAVALAREVAVALVHTHGKGVLHCDLKPANVLLDGDGHPRLADFGQSRLSNEQTPALGTLFYMAPEQADLDAAPDARWDVYALGALLYCMLTGRPPYRDESTVAGLGGRTGLEDRLARYRRLIREAPRPSAHRRQPGVDRSLAEIVDRCLAPAPAQRFPNPQAVLDALDARAQRRARRPLLVLGALGPALLLSVVSLLAWNGFHVAVDESTRLLTRSARVSNEFAAQAFADHIALRIDRRWRVMENLAATPAFIRLVRDATAKGRDEPERAALQERLEALHREHTEIPSVAWAVYDPEGLMLARSPADPKTIGRNFAFRDFFHGRGTNLAPGTRTAPVTDVHRSIIYRSQATGRYRTVAFSVPVWGGEPGDPGRSVLGVLFTSIEVGDFADFEPRAGMDEDLVPVLIDAREDEGGRRGAVLIHPYLSELRRRDPHGKLPEIFIDPQAIRPWDSDYRDPVGRAHPEFSGRWFAASEPVVIDGRRGGNRDTGWVVIIQERYGAVIGPVLALKAKLVRRGVLTLIVIILMLTALWGIVLWVLNGRSRLRPSALWRPRSGKASSGAGGVGSGRASGGRGASASTVAWPPGPATKVGARPSA